MIISIINVFVFSLFKIHICFGYIVLFDFSSSIERQKAMGKEKSMKIALLHPDLGIGGAERLMVDIALALQKQGHTVDMYARVRFIWRPVS